MRHEGCCAVYSPGDPLRLDKIEVGYEGGVSEIPTLVGIFSQVVLCSRVVSDGLFHAVSPEGECAVAEEVPRNVRAQGGHPFSPPYGVGVVATVSCVIQGSRVWCHDGYLRDRRSKLELAHGAVAITVSGGVQDPRNIRGQMQVPEAHTIAQAPETPPRPHCHALCVTCHMGGVGTKFIMWVGHAPRSATSFCQSMSLVWYPGVRRRRTEVWLRDHWRWPKSTPLPGRARAMLHKIPTSQDQHRQEYNCRTDGGGPPGLRRTLRDGRRKV